MRNLISWKVNLQTGSCSRTTIPSANTMLSRRIKKMNRKGHACRTDEAPLISFVLEGPPRTKKNSARIDTRGGRIRKLPSKAYEAWNDMVQPQLMLVRIKAPEGLLPITCPINVEARFFRHADVGDAVGFYQGLADVLEEGGIVQDDSQIRSWDGS